MLVLSRREGEEIKVITPQGDEIVIAVAKSRGKVRLGVDAPRDYKIVRTELAALPTEGTEVHVG